MNRGDVSFTFLHRIEEIELNIDDQRWQSALALALTLPDICGGIAFPEIVKKYRDGRVRMDRQNNPTRDVGAQYVSWFDMYAAPYFKLEPEDEQPYICGERCWQLRCEYLHQNKGFLNDEKEAEVRFHLGVNCGTSVCQMANQKLAKDEMDIRIDIKQFCLRMCQAARNYYESARDEKDFGLYNTPVLDFIQMTRGKKPNKKIIIMCENEAYGRGLKMIVEKLYRYVFVNEMTEKEQPALWIVSKEMLKHERQPWNTDKKTPVILLTDTDMAEDLLNKNPGKAEVLVQPVLPETLREKVKGYLK